VTHQSEFEAPRLYPTMRCRDTEAMIGWLNNRQKAVDDARHWSLPVVPSPER